MVGLKVVGGAAAHKHQSSKGMLEKSHGPAMTV